MKYGIILLLFFTVALFSQKYPKQQIGLGYSLYSGAGISYQIEIDPYWAFKVNTIVYYYGFDPPDVIDLYTNFGLELQRNFYKDEKNRMYLLAGASYWFFENRSKTTEFINDKMIVNKEVETENIWNFGLGTGYEYKLLKQFSVSFDIGLHFQTSGETNFSPFYDRNPKGTEFFGIGGSIGFRYNF